MPITTGLFQVGVVLEGLHHEAADEGVHRIVVLVHMGRMEGSVILVQQDVGWFAVGPVKPGGKVFDGLGIVTVRSISVLDFLIKKLTFKKIAMSLKFIRYE